jgi:hypothetical protein
MDNENNVLKNVVIIKQEKSIGLAMLLAFLFGPLGLLYVSIVGGILMLIISIVVAILTFGLGLLITWPLCIVWGGLAAARYNELLSKTHHSN